MSDFRQASMQCFRIEYVESFKLVMINQGNRLIGVSKIAVGGVGGTVADPKKIFQTALKANSNALIICHYAG